MAKKTLLSEGHIRKFMKLAAIGPLTENFLSEEEEPMEEATELTEAEEVEEEEVGAPEGDMEMDDEEMGMGDPEGDEDAIKAALEQLIDAIKAAPETDIAVDAADETETDEMTDPIEEMAMDPMEEASCGSMEEDIYEELNEAVEVVDTQAIVKKVTRRVAERLIKESKQDKLAEVLAAKIAAKLG